MGALLLYILKSTICLTLFYLGFKALLSNDTFFRFNRWVLLGGVMICMLLPAIKIQTSEPLLIQQPIIQLEKIIAGEDLGGIFIPGNNPVEMAIPATARLTNIDWGLLLGLFYLSGCVFCLLTTLLSFRKMFVLFGSGRKLQLDCYTLILLPEPVSPFSWGHYIILSEEDYEYYSDEILTHEIMHLKSHHSADLIFMEIILLLHWFNPAVWLLKRELKDIHEYQADKGVLALGIDATKYQLLLVKKAVGSSLYTLANSFNHSKIKKRITMMLKGKSNSWARLKLLLLVPVGLIVLNAFASPAMDRQLETLIPSKGKETTSEPQQSMRSFFMTELNKYIEKADPKSGFSTDEIIAFLKKNTEIQNLFINANGDVLLNNNHASYAQPDQFLAKLQTLFASSEKPVSFYVLIDVATPKNACETVLGLVKQAFEKQQAAVGADKAPFLVFQDPRSKNGTGVKEQKSKQNVAYYTVDGQKVMPQKYDEMKNNFKRITPRKSDLSDAKGKVVEIHTYIKLDDGSIVTSPAAYAEMATE